MLTLQKRWIALVLCAACLAPATLLAPARAAAEIRAAHDIVWAGQITLNPPGGTMGRYPRLLKLTSGPASGDILLTYQTERTGGDFLMYRSSDQGRTWAEAVLVNKATPEWDYASCNIIQLTDGRLLMSMQRRLRGSNLGKDFYIDVKFSDDGGRAWGPPAQVFQGANWEGRPFEVPNDLNGDGIRDIYLFYTQRVIDTKTAANKATRRDDFGRAVAFIASYDGGATWGDRNPERFTGAIIHREYREGRKIKPSDASGGGMPQPFLLPDNRVGFVVEELGKLVSPLIIANDPGDWDWTGPDFQGPWTSADYDGARDDNVYPSDKANVWAPQDIEVGKAPYIAALPDGRYVMATQANDQLRVWVGDSEARNFRPQELPFPTKAAYAAIEPISDSEVLVVGGSSDPKDNFIYLRFGTLQP